MEVSNNKHNSRQYYDALESFYKVSNTVEHLQEAGSISIEQLSASIKQYEAGEINEKQLSKQLF